MAEVQPLRTLRYEPAAAGPLEDVIAPPYDVIDEELARGARGPQPVQRRGDRSPARGRRRPVPARGRHHGRLARARCAGPRGGTGRLGAAPGLHGSRRPRPRPHRTPRARARGGVRTGRIRPHERTHPGPKEDRLRLTRATQANLSPIFSLFPDGDGSARAALEQATAAEPFATARTTRAPATRSGGWRAPKPWTPCATRSPARSC